MEAGHEQFRIGHGERGHDVGARPLIGGRGQRQTRHTGEPFGKSGKPAILRAEFVPPLGDAVCLVDGDQRDAQMRQPLQHAVAEQPFGRDVDEVKRPLDQVAGDAACLGRVEVRVQRPGRDADLAQRGNLVIHQRDQRRDHHGGARPADRRYLIADAFAAAGRHQHQGIAAGQHVTDHRLLQAAKCRKPEHPPQDLRRVRERRDVVHPVNAGGS